MIPIHQGFPSDLVSGFCCQCKKATSRHCTKLRDLRCIDFHFVLFNDAEA